MQPRSAAVLLIAVLLAGCSSSNSADSAAPATISTSSAPATTTTTTPVETERVYLATALACSLLSEETARFTPLKVKAAGISTTLEPIEDCQEQRIFNSYVFDVPMPKSGKIQLTPGNQPTAEVDAAKLRASDGVTVFYGRKVRADTR